MNITAFDIGSNTARMLIASYDKAKKSIKPLMYEMEITRLARGVANSGTLNKDAIDETIEAIKGFVYWHNDMNPKGPVVAVATEALRQASNAEDFIQKFKNEVGLNLLVIDAQMEAELTALGVVNGLSEPLVDGETVVLDIGGGSTELIVLEGGTVRQSESMTLGVVKLSEDILKNNPPTPAEIVRLKNFTKTALNMFVRRFSSLNSQTLIGTAGTITTLAAIELELEPYVRERIAMHKLSLSGLRDLFDKMCSMSLKERAGLKGLSAKRADLIIPGTAILIATMEALDINELTVSDSGLLEGVALSTAEHYID